MADLLARLLREPVVIIMPDGDTFWAQPLSMRDAIELAQMPREEPADYMALVAETLRRVVIDERGNPYFDDAHPAATLLEMIEPNIATAMVAAFNQQTAFGAEAVNDEDPADPLSVSPSDTPGSGE